MEHTSPKMDEPIRREFAPASPEAARLVRRNAPIRQGRTCYDHLAGLIGVSLFNALLQRGWLEQVSDGGKRPEYLLTETGTHALEERGVDVQGARRARRLYAYGCQDWTERQFHLGGALGAAILDAMLAAGIVQREEGRLVTLRESPDRWMD